MDIPEIDPQIYKIFFDHLGRIPTLEEILKYSAAKNDITFKNLAELDVPQEWFPFLLEKKDIHKLLKTGEQRNSHRFMFMRILQYVIKLGQAPSIYSDRREFIETLSNYAQRDNKEQRNYIKKLCVELFTGEYYLFGWWDNKTIKLFAQLLNDYDIDPFAIKPIPPSNKKVVDKILELCA